MHSNATIDLVAKAQQPSHEQADLIYIKMLSQILYTRQFQKHLFI